MKSVKAYSYTIEWRFIMFLKKDKRPNGRIYLSIVKSYRDPVDKKPKQEKVKTLGYVDELEKEYEDPIAYFTAYAQQLTQAEKEAQSPIKFTFDPNEQVDSSQVLRKNIGYFALSWLYHQLKLDQFWNSRQQSLSMDYSLNHVFQCLGFLRILKPCSKRKSHQLTQNFFFPYDFSLDDTYRALDYFIQYKEAFITHLYEEIQARQPRDVRNVYYDVSNYYFETNIEDDLRKKGYSKERKNKPIVQMGLLLDNQGIPMTYRLFKGNTHDSQTLMPVLDELKQSYQFDRIIVIGDRGINSGENMAYQLLHKNGYIYSQTIRGGSEILKNYVLDESDYIQLNEDFKYKSQKVATNIWVVNTKGKRVQVEVDQKQVVFYSAKYARRNAKERQKSIDKALSLIQSGETKLDQGARKYIKQSAMDPETGEIIELALSDYLDTERIEEEKKYDGYYLLVTSELEMPDMEIIENYRGLWQIENAFKVTKSVLETRPVYVSRQTRIESHFLICFTALTLLRLLEIELEQQFSPERLIESLNQLSVTYLTQNYYMLDYRDEVTEALSERLGIDFTQRFWTQNELRIAHSDAKQKM